jgi:hypothetical protein
MWTSVSPWTRANIYGAGMQPGPTTGINGKAVQVDSIKPHVESAYGFST